MGITKASEDGDETVQWVEQKRGRYKKLIIRNGVLVGAILLGETGKAGYLMQAFERGTPLPEDREHLLFDIGAPPKAATLTDMPDTARVCNCNGVSKGTIRDCVLSGKRNVAEVMAATRAGTAAARAKDWCKKSSLGRASAPALKHKTVSLVRPRIVVFSTLIGNESVDEKPRDENFFY
jgi:nitrite reductase (NADH) large subunit